jgi:hypothetical protein
MDREQEHIKLAEKNGWYVHSEDMDDYARWLECCKELDWPYVEVQDKGKFALVNLDTISCKRGALTGEGARRVRMALLRYAVPKPATRTSEPREEYRCDVNGGLTPPTPGTSIWCGRIPRDKADEVAKAIIEIINQELVPWTGVTHEFVAPE